MAADVLFTADDVGLALADEAGLVFTSGRVWFHGTVSYNMLPAKPYRLYYQPGLWSPWKVQCMPRNLGPSRAVADAFDDLDLNDTQRAFIRWSDMIGTHFEAASRGKIDGVKSISDFFSFLKSEAAEGRRVKSAVKK